MTDGFSQSKAFAPLRLEQRGRAGELLPIVLLNTLLNIITLSIYRFWGKTKVRQYLWRQTCFMAEPLEYTGTGGELFKGFLVVFFVLLLPFGAISNLADFYLDPDGSMFTLFTVLLYVAIYFLFGLAIYRARRYRLSRTLWRGVRCGMQGSASQYAIRYLIFWVLTALTLGWAYPWMRLRLFQRLINETTFGDRNFRFGASSGALYGVFSVFWIGTVCLPIFVLFQILSISFEGVSMEDALVNLLSAEWAVGLLIWLMIIYLCWSWYRAHEINHFAQGTSFQGIAFRMSSTVWNLMGLITLNGLVIILTLGFGLPFTQLRTFRYFCDHLSIAGELNPAWIRQSGIAEPSTGEGLADAFDMGAV